MLDYEAMQMSTYMVTVTATGSGAGSDRHHPDVTINVTDVDGRPGSKVRHRRYPRHQRR